MLFELLAITSVYLALRTLKWRYWIPYGARITPRLYFNLGAAFFAIGTAYLIVFSIATAADADGGHKSIDNPMPEAR